MKVSNTPQNRKKCLCPNCPSYPKKCQGEVLYCATGTSQCGINAQGCICPGCPVYAEYELSELYYCDKEEDEESGVRMRKIKSCEDKNFYQSILDIKKIAESGKSIVRSMGSQKEMPFSFSDLHFIPAQIAKIPLNSEDEVNTKIIIGPKAIKPLKVNSPIIISGMSFGATSKNAKLVISQVAVKLRIAYNSGEGGILPEELKTSFEYLIGQYATGRFGVNEDILKKVAAVEIRFGQGAYPGKGSYLPAEKMTKEVAELRGLKGGEAAYSPANHHDIKNPKELKEKIEWLKKITGGVPIGAKIGCGSIEKDIEILVDAGIDFISIDGFGGGTGATDYYIRENVGLPLIAALPRAAEVLRKLKVKNLVTLIAGGGLRTSADFAKCLALGANAVYVGTAALIAVGCEQYRICHTGKCPTGVTAHNPILEKQLKVEEGIKKLSNFINISTEEISNITRIAGKDDVKKLEKSDLVSLKKDLAEITGISWLI